VLAARYWAVVVGVVGVVGVCRVEGTGWNRHQIQRRAEDRISNGDSLLRTAAVPGGELSTLRRARTSQLNVSIGPKRRISRQYGGFQNCRCVW
jgi:hypothetical protein